MEYNTQQIQLVAVNLDGTLLRTDKSISKPDLETLTRLGNSGIIRVAATGRSLFKVRDVLPLSAPVDYVVFSSGTGIYDWKNQVLLHREFFTAKTTREIIAHLLAGSFNFFVYHPIPENNLFYYHRGAEPCNEFEHYLNYHKGDFQPLSGNDHKLIAGQIMSVIPNQTEKFESLKAEIIAACNNVKVIRTTSPVDDQFIWLEIFPDTVSKGHGIKWLCDLLKINYSHTVGIGNDYNDLDMFEFVSHPYVLHNGVEALKEKFNTVLATNEENGLTQVIQKIMNEFNVG